MMAWMHLIDEILHYTSLLGCAVRGSNSLFFDISCNPSLIPHIGGDCLVHTDLCHLLSSRETNCCPIDLEACKDP